MHTNGAEDASGYGWAREKWVLSHRDTLVSFVTTRKKRRYMTKSTDTFVTIAARTFKVRTRVQARYTANYTELG